MSKMLHGNERITYVKFTPPFMKNCRPFKSWDEISIRGRVCNTLLLNMHLELASHEHKRHTSIHEHEHMKFHFIHLIYTTGDVDHIHAFACDNV